jgi:hypothetical protein
MMPEYDYDGRAPEIFDPRAAIKKQLRERGHSDRPVVVSARGQHGGSGGHSSAAPGATSGIGATPPQPQRDEPGDAITEAEGVNSSARESETPSGEPQKGIDEPSHETVPMTLRHRDGSEIPVTIEGDASFTFDGEKKRPRDMPAVIDQAIRDELTRLGAPALGAALTASTQSKALSFASLITALAMSSLDIEIPGVDENTRRAAEVLRTGQGRVAAIEMKVEQVLDNQKRAQKDLDAMTRRALSAEKQLYELELMLTWLLVDKTEPLLFNQVTSSAIDLTNKTVLDARARLREKARELDRAESVQRGRGQIVE